MDVAPKDPNLTAAYQQLAAQTRADRKGKIYVFTSPQSGVGTSYVVRQMALIAADMISDDRQVLVLDMDLQKNAQSEYFFSAEAQAALGASTGPFEATFGSVPFWRVTPSAVNEQGQNITDSNFVSLHIMERAKLSFSRFHWEQFRDGQNVHIQNARPYWQILRDRFAAVFIDTPALDRADILSTICPEADTSILVSSAAASKDQALSAAMKKIVDLGGHCSGVILNEGAGPASGQGAYYE